MAPMEDTSVLAVPLADPQLRAQLQSLHGSDPGLQPPQPQPHPRQKRTRRRKKPQRLKKISAPREHWDTKLHPWQRDLEAMRRMKAQPS